MAILLLGGNGFIGSHLAEALSARGDRVVVLDARAPRTDTQWRGIDYRRADPFAADALDAALADCDIVVHLASATTPATADADPVRDVEANLIGTLRLLEAMRRHGRRRLIYLSSGGTVYGNPTGLPVAESHALNPICAYGVVKVAVEHCIRIQADAGMLDPVVVRPSNPYGERQAASRAQGLIGIAMMRLLKGAPVQLWGDGGHVRDFLHVDDLVRLLVTAVHGNVSGVFNAGGGQGHRLDEVCALIERAAGTPLRIERLPARRFDVREIVLDIRAARDAFGWAPSIPLSDGVLRTWQILSRGARAVPYPPQRPSASTL
ncbi:MAG: NAD-dependent epimerase/dehydratase family protein [Xanthomonadales bacterium]|nr:NAD-dependent epimerase/dehydratase family protein [Xanthomonadales bacterium]